MGKGYVIYNPLAGSGSAKEDSKLLEMFFDEELEYYDITRITNYEVFLRGLEEEDFLIVAGGDGTLCRFANNICGIRMKNRIFYLPAGNGNDFANDMGKTSGNPFEITDCLKNLPTVEVKGQKYRFINGVGFGIDGYCCQVGDEIRKKSGKKINYAKIAVKGLLFHFAPRNAKVTVDGKEYSYKKVWIAPTMFGRFYGGGMIPTPMQSRNSGKISLMVFHDSGKLRTLCIFPGIFNGKHIKHTENVTIHTGKEISVEFDSPTPLQIDGETVKNVISYTAKFSGPEN